MAYKKEIKELAREYRKKGWSLGKITKKFNVAKSTAYLWIKDLPVPEIDGVNIQTKARRESVRNPERRKKHVEKCTQKRKKAYMKSYINAPKLLQNILLRDFIIIYLAEGYNRTKHSLSLVNTDPSVIRLGLYFLKKFSRNQIGFLLVCQIGKEKEILKFWSKQLNIPTSKFKTFSKELGKKRLRPLGHGICHIRTHDTYAKSRVDALIDYIKSQWDDAYAPIA